MLCARLKYSCSLVKVVTNRISKYIHTTSFINMPKKSKAPAKVSNKRKAESDDSDNEVKSKSKKSKAPTAAEKGKTTIPSINDLDFTSEAVSASGEKWNLKLSSWNINGIRAWLGKNGLGYIEKENPDIICFQETKCSDKSLPDDIKNLKGYNSFWLEAEQAGYSGVGLLSKIKPINVTYGIGYEEHDKEGRVLTAEYEAFYLVTAYVPNAGRGLVRLDYRQKFDEDFRTYLGNLKEKKPIILTGDLNVAHEEIDIANPKSNKKNAGFTVEERTNFSKLLSEGYIDTFRNLYPEKKGAYTFWTYMANARAKNVGWRLDYFVVSENFKDKVCDSLIRPDVHGSDHCPIVLLISI